MSLFGVSKKTVSRMIIAREQYNEEYEFKGIEPSRRALDADKRSSQIVAFMLGTLPKITLSKKIDWKSMTYPGLFSIELKYKHDSNGKIQFNKEGNFISRTDVTYKELLQYIDP